MCLYQGYMAHNTWPTAAGCIHHRERPSPVRLQETHRVCALLPAVPGWLLPMFAGAGSHTCCLIATAGPHHQHVGHGAEGGQVLNGLVGGAALTQANGVVGHHIDGTHLGPNKEQTAAAARSMTRFRQPWL